MTPEGQILRSILDYLAAEKIWCMRINTGAMSGSHNGKSWFVRFAKPGTADILAILTENMTFPLIEGGSKKVWVQRVVWIEVKTAKGKQSTAQIDFQKEVEVEGHVYIVARSIEDVQEALRDN